MSNSTNRFRAFQDRVGNSDGPPSPAMHDTTPKIVKALYRLGDLTPCWRVVSEKECRTFGKRATKVLEVIQDQERLQGDSGFDNCCRDGRFLTRLKIANSQPAPTASRVRFRN